MKSGVEGEIFMIFKQDTLDFLKDIKKNNCKDWFTKNKDRYNDSLLSPLKELVVQLSETMLKIDPELETEPRVDRTISRIYRDTRFSKDKSLYRNNAWVSFKRKGRDKLDYPVFFFELSPHGFRYGMGFYSATVQSMNAIREKIDRDEKKFIQIIDQLQSKCIFSPEGDLYKRNRYQGTEDKVKDWYNRKNLYLMHHSENINEIFSNRFVYRLKEDYESLSAIYHFFTEAINEQWMKSEGFERE